MKVNELIQQITEQVHKNANVRVVFGDLIDKGEITIIPVAKVIVRGGGGGGKGPQNQSPEPQTEDKPQENKTGHGMGLGLEISTTPLGYIHIKNGEARFKEITDTTKIATNGMIFAGFMMFMFARIVIFAMRTFKSKSPKHPPLTGTKK